MPSRRARSPSSPHSSKPCTNTSVSAAVRKALGDAYGTPAQVALRFVLGNRDLSTRIIGISDLAHLYEALVALEQGPLPAAAITKLEGLRTTDFG